MQSIFVPFVALSLCVSACAGGRTGAAAAPQVAAADSTFASVPEPIFRVPVEGLPSIGNRSALVTMVLFTDYECAFCRRAESTIAQLRARYGADLRVVVAEHPMPMHANGRPAALAALAADDQGHFESMHARLFAGPLDEASIQQAAKAEGLDLARFDADRRGEAVDALERAEKIGKTLNVSGTPMSFINGRKVAGAVPVEEFEAIIDERLAAARKLVASGVHPEDVYQKTVEGGLATNPEDC